jgi:hypothetical protein
MAIVGKQTIDGYHYPAGPPKRAALNVVWGRVQLAAGSASEAVTGIVPATAHLSVVYESFSAPGFLKINYVPGSPDRVVITSTSSDDTSTVAWRAEW